MTFSESEVTVGRVPGNDVVLPKGNVSKRHSRIVLKDNRFIVVDLKSTNGTYVNGRKITSPLVVKEGDKIYVGDYVLTLEGAPALDALRPPSLLAPESGGKPLLTPVAPALPGRTLEGALEDDSVMPVVLRGGPMTNSSMPPTSAESDELPEVLGAEHGELGGDEDDAILPAESELEVFEDRSSREQARLESGDGFSVDRGVEPLPARMPPVPVKRGMRTQELAARDELLGPIDLVLADPEVFHVVVERFDRVRADRGEGLVVEDVRFATPYDLVKTAWDVAATAGVSSAAASYDVSLANGLQVVAVLPTAASNGPIISVRRRPTKLHTLAELAEREHLTGSLTSKLEEALRARRHVWVVGSHGADLARFGAAVVASFDPDERIALFERAPEIALGGRSALCLKLGAVPVEELLNRVQSFRPERLLLHALREDELGPVLSDFAHRADGSVALIEARSARDALASFDRAVGGDLALRAASLLIDLRRSEGKLQASAYDVELDGSGELSLKAL